MDAPEGAFCLGAFLWIGVEITLDLLEIVLLAKGEVQIMYAIKIRDEDIRLLPVTNIDAYTSKICGIGHRIYETSSREAFDGWCVALTRAKKEYEVISNP